MFDPFGINNQINAMLGNMPGNNRNNRNNGRNGNNNSNQVSIRNNFDPFGMNMSSPFDMMNQHQAMMSNPFAMMNQMMMSSPFGMGGDMHHNIIHADPNSQIYSSSSVMTVTNTDGKPKVYQESTQIQQGPGGVKETRNLVRDSEKGIEKVSIGHHIGDKAHVIERQKQRGGAVEEMVNLENLDEDEIQEFNKEFENKIRQSHMASNYHQHQHRAHPHINSHQQQPFAIEDGHAHGHKKDRKPKSRSKQ